MDLAKLPHTPHYTAVPFVHIFPALDKNALFELLAYFNGEWHDLIEEELPSKDIMDTLFITKITPFYDEYTKMSGLHVEVSDTIEITEVPSWLNNGYTGITDRPESPNPL